MGLDEIPIRRDAGRQLAKRDTQALDRELTRAFRFERAQLRLEVALKNGLGEREALRLQELSKPLPTWARWRRKLNQLRPSLNVGVAAAAFAAAAAATVVWSNLDPPELESTQLLAAAGQTHFYQLEDGSSVELQPGAQGRLSLGSDSVAFELDRGAVEFELAPGARRQWRVTADEYELEVSNTQFSIDYQPKERFTVEVEQGKVAVHVPQQETPLLLSAGSRLEANTEEVRLHHGWSVHTALAAPTTASQADADGLPQEKAPGNGVDQRLADAREIRSGGGKTGKTRPQSNADEPSTGKPERAVSRPAKPSAAAETPATTPAAAQELRLLRRARRATASRDHQAALNLLATHKRRFPLGQLTEEREALRVEALRGLGRDREAQKAAGEFRERFPKSVLSTQMPGK